VPSSDAHIRIPGGIDLPSFARTPGWNMVTVSTEEIVVNGRLVENAMGIPVAGDPADLSCYVTRIPQGASYVLLDAFRRTSLEDQKFQTRITNAKSVEPDLNGQLTIDALDNQTLRIQYRGLDGVVRRTTLSLQQ